MITPIIIWKDKVYLHIRMYKYDWFSIMINFLQPLSRAEFGAEIAENSLNSRQNFARHDG